MNRKSLKFKVGFSLVIALTVVVFLFTWMVVHNNRKQLMQQAQSSAAQLSEAIIDSTRFAMLENKPSFVDRIIEDVGTHEDIERVRILNKNGTIIHSSHAPEIGMLIDLKAESCLACHQDQKLRGQIPMQGQPRIFSDAGGKHVLGSTAVIMNEPSCSDSDCHVHDKDQMVLGVLDIVSPLAKMDQAIRSSTLSIIGMALSFTVLVAILVAILIDRILFRPLRDLEEIAGQLAETDLEQKIPVRSRDEFGQLASSFNSMAESVRQSRRELMEWGQTLEQQVETAKQELRQAKAEITRGEKLASVGLLTAGIAHELNNPLTSVLTFAHVVRRQLPDDSQEAEDLDVVIQESKRCAEIVKRLLDFAREKAPEKELSEINLLIEKSTSLFRQSTDMPDVEIQMDLEENLPAIWVDKGLIKQVLINLLVNAQHAINDKGVISLRSRLCAEYQNVRTGEGPVPMLEITVSDTGVGIPENDLPRVFDPFFTTKVVGTGTGLGLSVSYGNIRAHDGEIEVDSMVGEGTQFRIYLPVAGAESKPHIAPA